MSLRIVGRTLVEAVRRQYRLAAQAVDRADKDAEIKTFGP
jgi:hypothetical protein